MIGDDGARFENLVASSLLKRLPFLEDRAGFRHELRYLRDKEGRKKDFAIVKEGVLEEPIEAKYSDENIQIPSLFLQSAKAKKNYPDRREAKKTL